jgi:hypothetical protein
MHYKHDESSASILAKVLSKSSFRAHGRDVSAFGGMIFKNRKAESKTHGLLNSSTKGTKLGGPCLLLKRRKAISLALADHRSMDSRTMSWKGRTLQKVCL